MPAPPDGGPGTSSWPDTTVSIIEGAADTPVYLWITDGKAELRDASALWGLDSDQTQEAIRAELGDPKIKVACIGPAGEKQVLLAAVMNDEQRAAGRGGAGAVMGSKKLKAIAVRGSMKIPVADEATAERDLQGVARPAVAITPSSRSSLRMAPTSCWSTAG